MSLTATASVAEGGNITYTAALTSAAQSAVTVTLSNGATITIAAGASAGSVSVPAPSDDVYVDAGSVSATISSASGGNFESLAVNPAAATTAITDTVDATTVSLTATPSVAEGGNIVYTASLTGTAQSAVTVTLSNGATITIVAGASSGTVSVPAPGDDVYVDAANVSATISSATGGNFENLAINPAAAVTSVTDTVNTTTVSLTATPSVAEGGNITYTASLTSAANTAVTVTLDNGATITIAAGASSGSVSVAAPSDDVYIDAGIVSATISSAAGGNFENLVVNRAAAVTSVTDTVNATTVSLTGSGAIVEGASGSYTVSLTSPAQTAVTVNLAYSGTASNGTDYTGVASVTIPAGASSATFNIASIDDALADSGEAFTVSLASATGGNFESLVLSGSANSVTTTISDEAAPDTVLVSLTGPSAVTEGLTTTNYTLTLSQPAVSAVTINLTYAGTATDGSDYTRVVSVVIPAGASSTTFNLATLDDVVADSGETIVVGVGVDHRRRLRSDRRQPGEQQRHDDDLRRSVGRRDHGQPERIGDASPKAAAITYTATLTNPAATPVTVNLSNGATITIAAGATSGTVNVAAPGDDVYVDAGNVSATISDASGGNFENLAVNPRGRDHQRHRHGQHHRSALAPRRAWPKAAASSTPPR